MWRAEYIRALLLLVLISGSSLDPILRFGTKGRDAKFDRFNGSDEYLLYRIGEDGDLLLVNCSQTDSPQPDGYEIACPGEEFGFRFQNLTMSQSGDYRVEVWQANNSYIESSIYCLTVCAEGQVDFSGHWMVHGLLHTRNGTTLCEFDSSVGKGSTLQLYEYDPDSRDVTLVLDTSSSLEPLVPHLRGRMHVDPNTLVVTLTGFMNGAVLCTMWSGGQCQHTIIHELTPTPTVIVTYEKTNITLPCTFIGDFPEEVHWITPTGDVFISSNQTQPKEGMYMLNGSQSGDYSLIIPYVSGSGSYECTHDKLIINLIFLSVCVEFSPVKVMFSRGESVVMDAYLNDSAMLLRAKWFRQKGVHPQMLIIDHIESKISFGVSDVQMPEDLMGRVTVFNSNMSLNISNLTAEDSGVYTWRIDGFVLGLDFEWEFACYEGSVHLLHRDPFGVTSPFYSAYASVLAGVLLGLIAAVIWVSMRSRKGQQISGHQSREGRQSGDEDLYDVVEEVEDSA